MSFPFGPNEIKELIPSTTGSVCEKLIRLLREFPVRFYEMIRFQIKEDGTFTQEFIDMVCDTDCFYSCYDLTDGTPGPIYDDDDDTTDQSITYSWTGDFQYFTVPAGVTALNIAAWAAGGGGGAAYRAPFEVVGYGGCRAGGGGGGGEYRKSTGVAVTPGELIKIYVGRGGAGGSSGIGDPHNGVSGETSIVEHNTGGGILATVSGQGGTVGDSPGEVGTGGTGGAGGSGGVVVEPGTDGQSGDYDYPGGVEACTSSGGPGGEAFDFTGGPAGTGALGATPGYGGGGGAIGNSGSGGSAGRGGSGRVIISWNNP